MSRWLTVIPLVVLVALAALFIGWSLNREPLFKPDALVGQTLPETVLPILEGGVAGPQNVDLRTAGVGRPMIVNLFASWCAPCIAEMPQLDQLAAGRRGRMVVLPVSQDMEGWMAVNKFFSAGKFNTLEPYVDQPGSYAETIKAKGLPVSILYDEKGLEVWRVAGTPDWNELAKQGIV
jgi:cytochrome c biogenesis protein CcmG/thiol:disulfide interchange protein DsbE